MKFPARLVIVSSLLLVGCGGPPPGPPPAADALPVPADLMPPGMSQPGMATAAPETGGGPIGPDGRAVASFQGPSFSVAPDMTFGNCLVVYRSGSTFPLSLQTPGAQVAMGGQCPSTFWQATTANAGALGRQGQVNVQGIGACRLPPFVQRPDQAQNCL